MSATATDELRRLLDERGVEWRERVWGGKHSITTFWHARGVRWHYRENRFGELRLHADGLSPEQAIDATLGSCNCSNSERTNETCRNVCNSVSEFTCSECGFNCDLTSWISLFDGDDGRHRHHHLGIPNFCPNCGKRKEVDA